MSNVSPEFMSLLGTLAESPEKATPQEIVVIVESLRSHLQRAEGDALVRDKYVALLHHYKQMLDRGNHYARQARKDLLDSIGPTKWAVGCVLDQTIGYYTVTEGATTKHPEAVLYDSEAEAERVMVEHRYDFVEAVLDEQEFRSREDTW